MSPSNSKSNNSEIELSIVIPVYNEEQTLSTVLDQISEQDWGAKIEVIIVDDGSKDRSPQIASQYSQKNRLFRSLVNQTNLGKSQTVKRGILESIGKYVVIQDADLEYEVNELAEMFRIIRKEDYDVLYGNRFGHNNKIIYMQNYIGNHFVSMFSNFFTYPRIKVYIPDMEVCYKMGRGGIFREIAQTIESKSNFGFEPEITAKFSKYGKLKFGIHPIHYHARSVEEGKKMKAFRDGFKAAYEIVKFNVFK